MSTVMDIPSEKLPLWMRQARRGVDWGVLIAAAFSFAVAWAFIVHSGLPHSNASENYVYRTADYAQGLQEGRLYPRWSPNAFGGYGAPIPNYYPPGAPYLAALIDVLFTNNPVTAVRVVYILSLGMAGAMTYVLVMRWAGAAAGILASVLYVYSPYVGLVAPYILGDLPAVVALALLPGLLWYVTRLIQLNGALDLAGVALVTAALLVTDGAIGIAGLCLVVVLLLWSSITGRQKQTLFTGIAACAIGTGLAGFYWMPALLEQGAVQWRAASVSPLPVTLSFPELIAPVRQVDLAELVITPQLTIGTVALVFAILGLLAVLLVRKNTGFQALFLICGVLLIGVSIIAFPSKIRLLGPVMLCLAVGGSASLRLWDRLPVHWLTAWRKRLHLRQASLSGGANQLNRILFTVNRPNAWKRSLLPVLLVMIFIASIPVFAAPTWPESFGAVDPQAQVRYEQLGFGIAVLPPGASVPTTISESLSPNRNLLSGYSLGTINKIAPNQITVDTDVSLLAHHTHSDHFQIRTRRVTTLELLTAYFPGWRAVVGGKRVSLSPDPKTGLITVTIPRTQGDDLIVSLDSTPVRKNAWIIGGLMLAALVAMTWQRLRKPDSRYDDLNLLQPAEARLLGVVLVSFILLLALFAAAVIPLEVHARSGYALDNSFALENRTDRGLEVLAYRLQKTEFTPGDTVDFSLYWRTSRFLPANYQVQVYLLDLRQGISWYRSELRDPGGYPTRRWTTSHYVTDRYSIQLSDSIVPGDYQIAVEVYDCQIDCTPESRLTFFDRSGDVLGTVLRLPVSITITP